MQVIERLKDVRPGDIMIGPIGGLVGLGVGLGQLWLREAFRVGRLSVRHAGIVVEASVHHDGPTYREPSGQYRPVDEPTYRGSLSMNYYPNGVITAPRLVQAMPHGAEEIEMRHDTHWTPRHAYVRLPEDYLGQAADAAAIARLMVRAGVAYSPLSYGALGAWRNGWRTPRLETWIDRRRPQDGVYGYVSSATGRRLVPALPVEAICSVLVDQAWSLTGKRVMVGVPHQVVTPGALAGRLLVMPGATWGGVAFS